MNCSVQRALSLQDLRFTSVGSRRLSRLISIASARALDMVKCNRTSFPGFALASVCVTNCETVVETRYIFPGRSRLCVNGAMLSFRAASVSDLQKKPDHSQPTDFSRQVYGQGHCQSNARHKNGPQKRDSPWKFLLTTTLSEHSNLGNQVFRETL